MLRASKLDVNLYEEVETDKNAMPQAVAIIIIASVAAGIGSYSVGGLMGLIIGTAAALVSWFVWAYLIYLIGTKILPEPQTESNPGELLRTLGFATAPGAIRVLGLASFLRELVFFIASIWMLITMIIAVRQALDYKSTWRAIGVCLIGWAVQLVIIVLFFYFIGPVTP